MPVKRRSIVATLIVLGVSPPLFEMARAGELPGTASTVIVDPVVARRTTDLARMQRTTPYIVVLDVLPPAEPCLGLVCWPAAEFFVSNPLPDAGQDVSVECTAYGRDGSVLSRGMEKPGLYADQVAESLVVFRGADFDKFASVTCRVVSAAPNGLGQR